MIANQGGDRHTSGNLILLTQLKMTLYIINAPILNEYGLWEYSGTLTIDETRVILSAGLVSAVRHDASANILSQILNIPVPVNRIPITILPEHVAVILHLLNRLLESKLLDVVDSRC